MLKCCDIALANSNWSAKIDRLAKEQYSIPSEILMESAGALSAQKIIQYFSEHIKTHSVMVLCGPGHNGGDGLVLARHLHSLGIAVWVFAADETLSALVKTQKERLNSQKISIYSLNDFNKIKEKVKEVSIIVDALFGVGLTRDIEGYYGDLVEWINRYSRESGLDKGFVVSLDVPSGLGVDTGQIMGVCVRADLTLTYGLRKLGFYLQDGPGVVGHIVVLSIGFPRSLLKSSENKHFLVTKKWVSSVLPKRAAKDHKASQGHLLVLAGSPGFWGAGELCSVAAYRMGAGYVTWARQIDTDTVGRHHLQDMSPHLNNLFKSSDMRFAAKHGGLPWTLGKLDLQSRDMHAEKTRQNIGGDTPRFALKAKLVLSKLFKRGDLHNLQNSDNNVKAAAAQSLPFGGRRRRVAGDTGKHNLQSSDIDAAESRRNICGDTPPDVLQQRIEDKNLFLGKTAVVIGPGLAVSESTKNLVKRLMQTQLPVIMDASALAVCAQEKIFPLPSNWVITPHSGELGRFLVLKVVRWIRIVVLMHFVQVRNYPVLFY